MTWRERVLAAQERGHWEEEDFQLWRDWTRCPAAEQARACGVDLDNVVALADVPAKWRALWSIGNNFAVWTHKVARMLVAPSFFLEGLDILEDEALKIKRGAA
jgi:hypothetical protein